MAFNLCTRSVGILSIYSTYVGGSACRAANKLAESRQESRHTNELKFKHAPVLLLQTFNCVALSIDSYSLECLAKPIMLTEDEEIPIMRISKTYPTKHKIMQGAKS